MYLKIVLIVGSLEWNGIWFCFKCSSIFPFVCFSHVSCSLRGCEVLEGNVFLFEWPSRLGSLEGGHFPFIRSCDHRGFECSEGGHCVGLTAFDFTLLRGLQPLVFKLSLSLWDVCFYFCIGIRSYFLGYVKYQLYMCVGRSMFLYSSLPLFSL
jgi:hypothetical protein